MKYSHLSIFALIIISFSSLASEPKLIDLHRFADNPLQNDFFIEDDCKTNKYLTSDNDYFNCNNSLITQNYNLHINYIYDFTDYLVYGTSDGKMYLEDKINTSKELTPLILNREKAFDKFSSAECSLENNCILGCEQGDLDSHTQCLVDKSKERTAYLKNEILSDEYNIKSIQLQTKKYKVELRSSCDTGLFSCESVQYIGTSNKNKKSLTLVGKPYYGRRQNRNNVTQLGYFFINGTYEYYVDFSGILKVVNTKNNKTIIDENGVWRRVP